MRLIFILLFLSFQSVLICKEKITRLKAFVVYDAAKSDLQNHYKLDGRRMKKNLHGVASQTNLTLDIQVVPSNQITRQKLYSWIKTLTPKDVAIFYYAGKPFYSSLNDLWPSLDLSKGHMLSILSQKVLTNDIKQRHPHLSLVLFDCYNKVISIKKKSYSAAPTVPVCKKKIHHGFARLFVKSSGIVSACSMQRGENGFTLYQDRPVGGIFTQAIQDYLQYNCNKGSFFWDFLLDSVNDRCTYLSKQQQHPLLYRNVRDPKSGRHLIPKKKT
jgi:hypothetical protein